MGLELALFVSIDHGLLSLRSEFLFTLWLGSLLMNSMCAALAFVTGESIDATVAILDHSNAVRLTCVLGNLYHLDRPR